jgi:hypothetical protein
MKMGKIIDLKDRIEKSKDILIISKPWEFRKAYWKTTHFIQMLRSQAAKLESHREKIYRSGGNGIQHLPPHFVLKGGMAYTMRAMYTCRNNEKKMRQVYYLIGLMDCMINQVNPILRTDLLRAMYKKVFSMKEELNIHWYGPVDQVLLPIDSQYFKEFEYRAHLEKACTMKELYRTIRKGTDEMFDILSFEYVFYRPSLVDS